MSPGVFSTAAQLIQEVMSNDKWDVFHGLTVFFVSAMGNLWSNIKYIKLLSVEFPEHWILKHVMSYVENRRFLKSIISHEYKKVIIVTTYL